MNEKQLQLVTYEQAKVLKELGFDWNVEYYYNQYEELYRVNTNLDTLDMNNDPTNEYSAVYSAPTVALALKWCREVKGYDYSIIRERRPIEYSFSLLNGTHGIFHIKGYEAAESKLLDEIINSLK